MLRRKKTGQSTAEYAIVIGLVIAAAVAMQIYVKRGIQAKVKGAVDFVPNDSKNLLTGNQYEPYYSSSDMDQTSDTAESIDTQNAGKVIRSMTDNSAGNGTQTTTSLNTPL